MEERKYLIASGGNVEVSQKLELDLPYDPAVPLLSFRVAASDRFCSFSFLNEYLFIFLCPN